MHTKKIIFLAGLHRSGTSLVHTILRSHPELDGFANTGVPEDEGQFLQDVYLPGMAFGGPGRFGFNTASFMDETHPLATRQNAIRLFQEWRRYWHTDQAYLLEKSPPNLVRTRFLQHLFPQACFVVILRHPIAVAYATQKWSQTSIVSLLEHSLRCYERFWKDAPYLRRVYILRYEDFVSEPAAALQRLLDWIGVGPMPLEQAVRPDINEQYFQAWEATLRILTKRASWEIVTRLWRFEARANAFGYSFRQPRLLLPVSYPGPDGPESAAPGPPAPGAGVNRGG
jgi:hypothetical protein